jgi:uncharacterized membrane protein
LRSAFIKRYYTSYLTATDPWVSEVGSLFQFIVRAAQALMEIEQMKKKNHLLAVFTLGFLVGPMLAQAQYDYHPVDYPGAPATQLFGINDRGDAVGIGYTGDDTFPFVYDSKKDTYTDVPSLDGYDATYVLGINDAGVISGSATRQGEIGRDAFVRDKHGNFTVFSHPDAASTTLPRSINNKGLVTGFRDSAEGTFYGFIYDPKSDTFTDLNPTSFFTIAQGINSRGEVVGSSNFNEENDPCPESASPFRRYGWLRATDGAVTYFTVNDSHTSARGIADDGSVVGFVIDLDAGKFKGFKTKLDGSQCQSLTISSGDLLDFPGSLDNFLQGVSNKGVITGGYDTADDTRSFIATPQKGGKKK